MRIKKTKHVNFCGFDGVVDATPSFFHADAAAAATASVSGNEEVRLSVTANFAGDQLFRLRSRINHSWHNAACVLVPRRSTCCEVGPASFCCANERPAFFLVSSGVLPRCVVSFFVKFWALSVRRRLLLLACALGVLGQFVVILTFLFTRFNAVA